MRNALRAEWTKLRTVPSNILILIGLFGVMVAGAVAADEVGVPVLSGVHFAQIAAIAVAVALVCGEFQPRLLRTTFAMNPRRGIVFGAKAAAVGAVVFATATPGVGAAVLTDRGFLDLSVGWRAAVGTVLYLVLIGLFSVGVAAVIRHAGAAIGAMLTVLYGPYLLTVLVPMSTVALNRVRHAAPMMAGLAVQDTAGPPHPWAGLAVLGAYAAAALLLGGILFIRRDA